jgi:hypothetical protein
MVRDLNKFYPFYLYFVEKYVTGELCCRYGLEPFEALGRFLNSETYKMLCDPELAMWEYPNYAILAIWECEQITGNPCNSVYIRGEA